MELWEAAGGHCSANERRADEASRDVEAWLKCRYMRERLGEEFTGTVTGVAGFGLFVTLDALYVEGLVHITELGGEYYRFDEARQELRGERTGIRYAMGARVRVQVSRVDLDGRKIDFRMVRDGDGERLLQRGQGGKPPAERADKVDSAAAELAAVKQADRASRGAAKAAKASQGGGKGVGGHPARARKPGPQRPAPRPRTRR
jgi:ribonuclease R